MLIDFYDLLNSIALFSITLVGIVLLIVIYTKRNNNLVYSYYSIALIFFICLRLFSGGLNLLFDNNFTSLLMLKIRPLFLLLLPLQYLYVKSVLNRRFNPNDFLHFILPIGVFLFINAYGIKQTFEFSKYIYAFVVLYICLYISLSIAYIILYKKNIKRDYALGNIEKNRLNKLWVYKIIFSIGLASIILIYFLTLEFLNSEYLFGKVSLISALLWLYCFFIIFKTPELIYGINYDIEKIISNDIWLKVSKRIINQADFNLNIKIQFNIKNYQRSIENLLCKSPPIDKIFDINELSTLLSIPSSYVRLIIKYYSKYSIIELKHFFRIREAKKLIQRNKNEKSLKEISHIVGYKSYSSFFREYKRYSKIT